MSLFGRSRVRDRILLEFFSKPQAKGHVREIARRIGASPATVGTELAALERLGILRSDSVGRSLVYTVNEASGYVPEVRALVQKTLGVEAVIRDALTNLPGVDAAYIFGSYASGRETPQSDIDLLVIGRPDRLMLSERLAPVERTLGRDINVVSRTVEQVRSRREAEAFWRRVLSGPLVLVAGQEGTF
jgi:predicted nucleotidyltransferase